MHRRAEQYPPESRAEVDAVETGDDGGCRLEPHYPARATERTVEPDGAVTFKVERHGHILGRPTKGVRSSAFRRELHTYRFTPGAGIQRVASEFRGVEIDEDMLAREQVDDYFTGGLWVEGDLPKLLACANEDEARIIADRYAKELDWLSAFEYAAEITKAQSEKLAEARADEFAERLVEWWRDWREESALEC